MKENLKKDYHKRTRKLLKTKQHRSKLIKRIKTCAVPIVRYLESVRKGSWEELKQMDHKTRKLMTKYNILYWLTLKIKWKPSGKAGVKNPKE